MSSKQPLSSKDIETINSQLQTLSPPSALVTSNSNSAVYQQSLKRWSAAAVKPAAAVLIPTSLPQLQAVLSYCTENSIDVAVKGGGHSTAGASSTDGGLLIDLGNSPVYSKVTVDTHSKLLHVGGGALWGDVDTAAFAHGLVSVGGTVADTGVGGLTLGGGYGWLSGIIGLVIDNLLSVTLVTAQGDIVKTSKEENEDLFWAIRGAGQNFGVVTEFVLQAHSYGSGKPDAIGGAKGSQAWAGMLFFDPETSPDMVEKVVTASNNLYRVRDFGQGGRTTTAGLGAGGVAIAKPPPMGGKTVLLVPVIYHGDEEKGKEAYKELLDLGPMMSTVAMIDYPAINHLLDVPPGFRVSMKGASFTVPIRLEFVRECISKFEEFTGRVNDAMGSLVLFELYDPTAVAGRATTSNTSTSFSNRGYHLNGMIAPVWTDAANDKECRQWARDMAQLFKDELLRKGEEVGDGLEGGVGVKGKEGDGAVMLYGNYDQYDEKPHQIFGHNYGRLQRLKAQYDPKNTFNKLFAVAPATS